MIGKSDKLWMTIGLLLVLSIGFSEGDDGQCGCTNETPFWYNKPKELDTCPIIQRSVDYLHLLMVKGSDKMESISRLYKNVGTKDKPVQQSSISSPKQSGKENKQENGNGNKSKRGNNHKNSPRNTTRLLVKNVRFLSPQQQDFADRCIVDIKCDRGAKYRTLDGRCNNFQFPMWGLAGSAAIRIGKANYHDGNSKLRKSKSGKELPNPRFLSYTFFRDCYNLDKLNTYWVMQWGQLVAHDTTHIIQQKSEDKGLDCCQAKSALHTDVCGPIHIPRNDQFYSKFNVTCFNFVRSVTTTNLKCFLSPRAQVIAVTHFLDASIIYGSTNDTARQLRAFEHGLLIARWVGNGEFPPQSDNATAECDNVGTKGKICYKTGDDRANQNLGMVLVQILLLREHNYLARVLKRLNPCWDDERLYQEARRILIAEVQRITYDVYLPIIIGESVFKEWNLTDGHGREPHVDAYNPLLNPSSINEFIAAAFRAFHSMIPREVILYDKYFNPYKTLYIDDYYFRPSIVQEYFSYLLRGHTLQHSTSQDRCFSVGVTNYLFKSNKPWGKDLESLDLQRGRDHGLPTYIEMRKFCGLPSAAHFDDLYDFMPSYAVELIAEHYEHVNDVDLFIGSIHEYPVEGGLVGPTFACIIAEQFFRWRNGDRFYYEFSNQTGSFTHEQLIVLRGVTLAEIICRNAEDIEQMPENVFLSLGESNPIKQCKDIMKMDFTPWKDYCPEDYSCEESSPEDYSSEDEGY